MTVVALAVMLTTNVILYQVAFKEKSESLIQAAQSQARLIEAMARYNRRTNRVDWEVPVGERGPDSLLSERAAADTIKQLKDAHRHYSGFGRTGEFVIAGIENEEIVFLLRHRHQLDSEPDSMPLYSDNAEPMRRALFSQSGVMVGNDYRGVKVLAAYEPVDVLNFGIVAKVDMSEIRAPFINGVFKTIVIAVLLIVFGSIFFRRITSPIITQITESEKRYRTLVEEINEWVWTTDQYGNITFSSAKIEQLIGYSSNELVNKPIVDLFDEKIRDEAKSFLTDQSSKKKAIIDYEIDVYGKTNRVISMAFSASPIYNEEGAFIGYRGIGHDITERKQAEQLRLQYQEQLESQVQERTRELHIINEELKSFTYIVSHDLRSPLVSITGFCSEIDNDIKQLQHMVSDNGLSKQNFDMVYNSIPESLEFINSATYKINGLINHILEISRIGERKLHIESVNVMAIVQANLAALAYQLDGVDVTLKQLPVVNSDALALEQIFGNILGNAVKFFASDRKGQITIWSQMSEQSIQFFIQDNGVGIAEKDLPHIFELFKRVGEQKTPGEGMGLTYVYSLVKRLGGDVSCQSALGEGTLFCVSLPLLE